MRHVAAPAEVVLWKFLRGRQVNGYKFRRQERVRGFIVDFVCVAARLIVKLDGDSHSDQIRYDQARTFVLKDAGYKVIRFENPEVFENLESVLEEILNNIEERCPSTPSR